MMLKMNVEFEDGVQPKEVMARVLENCKKLKMIAKFSFNEK